MADSSPDDEEPEAYHIGTLAVVLGRWNKYKGGIYMVFEYMDHDLIGLADRPEMRFSSLKIKGPIFS